MLRRGASVCPNAPWWALTPTQLSLPIRSEFLEKNHFGHYLLVHSFLSAPRAMPTTTASQETRTRQGKLANPDKCSPYRDQHGFQGGLLRAGALEAATPPPPAVGYIRRFLLWRSTPWASATCWISGMTTRHCCRTARHAASLS
jgi:hypothetical protein